MDLIHSSKEAAGHRRRLLAQVLALAAVALGTGGVTTFLHYRSEIHQEAEHLLDVSENLAHLFQASHQYHVAARDVFDPDRALNQTVQEFSAGQHAFEGFGTSGRVELWERSGDTLVSRLAPSAEEPAEQATTPWHLDPSGPVTRGLEGAAGTWDGPGPAGRRVIAAYQAVEIPNRALMLLVRVDRAEVLRPVTRAAAGAIGVALLLIALGAFFVRRLGEPAIRALADSEERFRSLYREAPLPYQSLDHQGEFLEVNPAFTKAFGYERDDLLGRSFAEILTLESREVFSRRFPRFKEHGQVNDTPFSLVTKDGGVREVMINGRFVRDRDGVTGRTHCVLIDVTERLASERATARAERRFRQLFEGMQEGFALHEMIWDEEGAPKDYRFLEVNPAFEDIAGMKSEEILGQTVLEIFPELEETWIQRYGEVVRSGEPVTFESHSAAVGARFRVHAFPGAENQFATVVFDVTEEWETQTKLAQSTGRLRALADRLSRIREEERVALSRELHDVLGPVLTGLRMDLEADRSHLPDPVPEPRRRITSHIRVVDESMELVKDICSRLRTPVLDVLGLGPAIQWQAEELQRRTETQFHLDLPESGPELGEHQRIAIFRMAQEALTNVLRHSQAENAWVGLRTDDHALTLIVEDDGRGLPPEHERSENGLGLVGMEERATALGGQLSLEARPGGGTVVRITVPL